MKKIIILVLILMLLSGLMMFWGKRSRKETSLPHGPPPSSYKIADVPYYGEKNFCYGAGTMMILRFYGLAEEQVQQFYQIVKTKGRGGPPDAFIGLRELNLGGKVHLGYSQNFNKEWDKCYRQFLKSTQSQIKTFTSTKEAFSHLKSIIASGTPVIALIQKGNHYVVVTGYDENYLYLSDPDPDFGKREMTINDFLAEWTNYQQDVKGDQIGFPGELGMIWLEGE